MHVQIEFVEGLADVHLGQGQRRLCRFLHHVAELPGEDELAGTRHLRCLDEQDVAADRRPGQSGRHARHRGALRQFVLEPGRAENGVQVPGIQRQGVGLPFGDLHGRGAQHRAEFALEVAHAGLAGVVADDRADGRICNRGLLRLESVGLELALHQVAPGDLKFLFLGIARKLDHFHAVAQRSGDRIELVRRSDEHHLRQVEIHAEIVVAEPGVLFGIEHFQQRTRRVAVETARAEFVDLVEHQHASARFRAPDRLDDVARQRADVGAPVAADLRFVMGAAQRDALELAPGGARDRLPERGLAHAGRADEAQDRALAVRIELPHREVFEDAALDLLQSVVILVEHLPGLRDVDGFGVADFPGKLAQPLEVSAQHRTLGAAFAHALQALQFLPGVLERFLGHARFVDRLLEVLDLSRAVLAFAEFLLDLAHLLAQHMLALALVELLAGLVADLPGKLQYFDALAQQPQHLVQAALQVEPFQHGLLFLVLRVQQVGHHVGQQRGRSHRLHHADEFVGHIRQQLDCLDRALLQLQEARLDLRA